jgi:hypothetical protein
MRDPMAKKDSTREIKQIGYQLAMDDHLYAMARTIAIHRAFVVLANQTLLTLSPKGTEN